MESGIASYFVGGRGGILMSVIAFSIVFLVIAGLMFMMMALKIIVKTINPDNKPAAPRAESASSAQRPPEAPPAARREPPASDDGELVAVFAAAIAEMGGRASAVLSYAPAETAFRRPSASAWKMAGILSNGRGLRD
jgi:Na+-transporting methylmalonyl-CoA/oxaloacetate decarboxylase gamma subunit